VGLHVSIIGEPRFRAPARLGLMLITSTDSVSPVIGILFGKDPLGFGKGPLCRQPPKVSARDPNLLRNPIAKPL
jgi:hypothetical protein